MNLNEKRLHECYAFELGIIVRNLHSDGRKGSFRRRALAEEILELRARAGDGKAIDVLNQLADERQS